MINLLYQVTKVVVQIIRRKEGKVCTSRDFLLITHLKHLITPRENVELQPPWDYVSFTMVERRGVAAINQELSPILVKQGKSMLLEVNSLPFESTLKTPPLHDKLVRFVMLRPSVQKFNHVYIEWVGELIIDFHCCMGKKSCVIPIIKSATT